MGAVSESICSFFVKCMPGSSDAAFGTYAEGHIGGGKAAPQLAAFFLRTFVPDLSKLGGPGYMCFAACFVRMSFTSDCTERHVGTA